MVVLQALVELSEQAAQELAEGSSAISRVAGLEARVAELEARDRTKANEELQKLREVAEEREAATEEKLRLEQKARRGTIRKSYCYVLYVVFFGLG